MEVEASPWEGEGKGRCIVIGAKAIEMPFGLWTRAGLRKCVLDGGPGHAKRQVRGAEGVVHCKV